VVEDYERILIILIRLTRGSDTTLSLSLSLSLSLILYLHSSGALSFSLCIVRVYQVYQDELAVFENGLMV